MTCPQCRNDVKLTLKTSTYKHLLRLRDEMELDCVCEVVDRLLDSYERAVQMQDDEAAQVVYVATRHNRPAHQIPLGDYTAGRMVTVCGKKARGYWRVLYEPGDNLCRDCFR